MCPQPPTPPVVIYIYKRANFNWTFGTIIIHTCCVYVRVSVREWVGGCCAVFGVRTEHRKRKKKNK